MADQSFVFSQAAGGVLEPAAAVKELTTTPRFFRWTYDDVYFGKLWVSSNGEFDLSQAYFVPNTLVLNGYSLFEQMTLNEVAPDLYALSSQAFPRDLYLVNHTRHEFECNSPTQLPQRPQTWANTDIIETVLRPRGYTKRGYKGTPLIPTLATSGCSICNPSKSRDLSELMDDYVTASLSNEGIEDALQEIVEAKTPAAVVVRAIDNTLVRLNKLSVSQRAVRRLRETREQIMG